MAAVGNGFKVLSTIFCLILFLANIVSGVRTKNKIYIDLKTQSACFRNLNATHQAGCTSNIRGNVGTIHYVQGSSDIEWILTNGPHAPYVALLNSVDFTGKNVRNLYLSPRCNGIMVINILDNSTGPSTLFPPKGFSTVDSCPNDAYGMYSKTPYEGCHSKVWNPAGNHLHFQDIGIPVFALSDPEDVDAVLNKCFYRFNNQSTTYPVCAAELKSRMDAVIDSVTCIRRSNRFALSLSGSPKYCDPLGDKNVVTTMKNTPQNETRLNESVILVAARLDATSLFQNEYKAADTTVTGLVTLLATAEALWKVKDEIRQNEMAKDIMFAFFQGETFDYIGSSRMVYDMSLGKFPQDFNKDTLHLHEIDLPHLQQIVELNQVGLREDEGSLWAHTDSFSRLNESTQSQVMQMVESLRAIGKNWNVTIQQARPNLPLPPASAQRFLRKRPDIPTVVITDHKENYTNKFYNSRLDVASLIDAVDYPEGMNESAKYDYITRQAELITNLSTTLAQYLYNASTGEYPSEELIQNMTADPLTVTHLLYCFLVSPICELFVESLDSDNADILKKAKQPFPFYVSVNSHTNEVTQLVKNIMARFTGERQLVSEDSCTEDATDKRYSYIWMQGPLEDSKRVGWCMKSLVQYTEALSPAFEIEDYDMLSAEYSTWTESRWGTSAIGVRLFLLPSQQFQVNILIVGVLMFIIFLTLVFICHLRSSVIFRGSTISSGLIVYNSMT